MRDARERWRSGRFEGRGAGGERGREPRAGMAGRRDGGRSVREWARLAGRRPFHVKRQIGRPAAGLWTTDLPNSADRREFIHRDLWINGWTTHHGTPWPTSTGPTHLVPDTAFGAPPGCDSDLSDESRGSCRSTCQAGTERQMAASAAPVQDPAGIASAGPTTPSVTGDQHDTEAGAIVDADDHIELVDEATPGVTGHGGSAAKAARIDSDPTTTGDRHEIAPRAGVSPTDILFGPSSGTDRDGRDDRSTHRRRLEPGRAPTATWADTPIAAATERNATRDRGAGRWAATSPYRRDPGLRRRQPEGRRRQDDHAP